MAGYTSIFNNPYTPQLNLGALGGYQPGMQVPVAPNPLNDNNSGGSNILDSLATTWGGNGFFGKNSVLGGTNEQGITTKGWAPVALGVGQAIMGAFQGQQAMKLGQEQFKEQKRQFDLNYGAQRQSMNTELEDRQRARVASNPGAYQSVSDYMNKNRIS